MWIMVIRTVTKYCWSRSHCALWWAPWTLTLSMVLHCTINSTPPGVSRGLGTDSTRNTMSNWEAMDNMNIMCHWVINQINARAIDLHRLNVIYWAWQRQIWKEHSAQCHQLRAARFGSDPRRESASFSQRLTHRAECVYWCCHRAAGIQLRSFHCRDEVMTVQCVWVGLHGDVRGIKTLLLCGAKCTLIIL